MTKNRTRTPVYLDPGMHPGLEVKGLKLPAWKVGDRGLEPRSDIQVSKKQNV